MSRTRLIVTGDESLDLIARKVIMASLIYYSLDEAIISDAQFDKWCQKLSNLWFRLDTYRQWQLGSRMEIRATGFHIKVSTASYGGAVSWLDTHDLLRAPVVPAKEWQLSKRHGVHYLSVNDFQWQKRMRIRL